MENAIFAFSPAKYATLEPKGGNLNARNSALCALPNPIDTDKEKYVITNKDRVKYDNQWLYAHSNCHRKDVSGELVTETITDTKSEGWSETKERTPTE